MIRFALPGAPTRARAASARVAALILRRKRDVAFATVLAALAFAGIAPPRLHAAEPPRCAALSIPKGAILASDGQWTALTPAQWQFMRGVYAMDPETPAGLPYGDAAVLARVPGKPGGLVFFIDGDKACTPVPIPAALIALLDAVAADEIRHEGAGL
jgi:hypothetical protein